MFLREKSLQARLPHNLSLTDSAPFVLERQLRRLKRVARREPTRPPLRGYRTRLDGSTMDSALIQNTSCMRLSIGSSALLCQRLCQC